jgi:hypothetical protein
MTHGQEIKHVLTQNNNFTDDIMEGIIGKQKSCVAQMIETQAKFHKLMDEA